MLISLAGALLSLASACLSCLGWAISVSISLGSTAVIFLTMTFYMLSSHQDVVTAM